jgi:hypothetical protein
MTRSKWIGMVFGATVLAGPSASGAWTVTNDSSSRSRRVWEYDGKRFTPIAVHVGLADGRWTELLGGSIRPGDALVTSAVLGQRPRM